MQHSSSGDVVYGLFGDMWADLEVPSSPPLNDSPIHSSATPSPTTTYATTTITTTTTTCTSIHSPMDSNSGNSTPELKEESSFTSTAVIPSEHHEHVNTSSSQPSDIPYMPPFISSATGISKKRKPSANTGGVEYPDKPSSPVAWIDYIYGPKAYPVHDALTFHSVMEQMDVIVQNVNSNSCYSPSDAAWICYRQNQFKVICLFRGPAPETMCVNDEGVPRRVQEVCARLYAVKEVAGVLGDEMRVGLHHVGKKRLKSAKQEVEITPFVKGKIEFTNLQFEKSNSVKRPQQQSEYFHIVVAIFVKCQDNSVFHIMSKLSPKIIVRGQNPGFYEDKDSTTASHAPVNTNMNDNMYNNVKYDSSSPSSADNSPKAIAECLPLSLTSSHPPTLAYQSSTFSQPFDPSVPHPTHLPPVPQDPSLFSETSPSHDPMQLVATQQQPWESERENTGLKRRGGGGVGGGGFTIKQEGVYEGGGGWQTIGMDTVVHHGKVGINTAIPMEALTVHGNVLVTGDMYKPSDRRIKTHLEVVDPCTQLTNIRNLKIYDYRVQNRNERGVIAQELATVLPEAVHPVGDMELNSITYPNFLVVNERMLLYENLGATQQLDKDLEEEKENIVNIHTQVSDLTAATNVDQEEVKSKMQFMVDVLFKEEYKKKVNYSGLEEEFVNFQFSVFRMGPARSLFLLGHFAPWLWVLGALYIFSNVRMRRCLGYLSLMRICITVAMEVLYTYHMVSRIGYLTNQYAAMTFAALALIGNYRRLKNQLHPKQEKVKDKKGKQKREGEVEAEGEEQLLDGADQVDNNGGEEKSSSSDSIRDKFIEEKTRQYEMYKQKQLEAIEIERESIQKEFPKKEKESGGKEKAKKMWEKFYDHILAYPNIGGKFET